jgi:hypothetical protein
MISTHIGIKNFQFYDDTLVRPIAKNMNPVNSKIDFFFVCDAIKLYIRLMFLRRLTSDNINIGLCFSILQKCIRRGMCEEALYYGKLIMVDGTPNALRKRLVLCCLEDMCRWDLALEIQNCNENELENYIIILCINKKTHISAYSQRVALNYIEHKIKPDTSLMCKLMELVTFYIDENWKELRKRLGNDGGKLFTFTSKSILVLSVFLFWNSMKELQYSLDRNLPEISPKKFSVIPDWVKDKHTGGGTKGYTFFFIHGLVMNNMVFSKPELYEEKCLEIYLNDELQFQNANTKSCLNRIKNIEKKEEKKNDTIDVMSYYTNLSLSTKYTNIIQVQLLTRRNNPCVYFCQFEGKKYVAKGPMNKEYKNQVEISEKLKATLNVPCIPTWFEVFNDEIWMISENLVDYTDDYVMKESKLEKNRPIYSGVFATLDIDKYLDILPFPSLIIPHLFKILVGGRY